MSAKKAPPIVRGKSLTYAENKARGRHRLEVWLESDLWEAIEARRADVPRAQYLDRVLRRSLGVERDE